MRLCSIASGSSGNCIYVGSEQTHLLIDTGISKKRIEEGLSALGVTGEDLDGILITHEHVDHIQGLGVFSRKYKVPIYATKGTICGICGCKNLGAMPDDLYHEIKADERFQIGEIAVLPFSIFHDANEPTGFRMEAEDKAVAVATDLGYYDEYVLGQLGHLSNELTGRLLCNILYDDLKHIVLGHLSKENNYPELALETVKLEVTMGDTPYNGEDLSLIVAKRDSISQILYV